MVDSREISKTQAVKNFLKSNAEATGKTIAEALEKQGISITASYAANIKSELNKQQRSKKSASKSAADSGSSGKATVNKTQAIKQYLATHKGAKPAQVVEALRKQGIEVKAGYVANIKTKSKRRRKAVKQVIETTGIGLPEIKAAISLLKLTNGEAGAREALAVAREIMKIV